MSRAGEGGKVVVLTGVTRGLGRALAEGMAALGHRIAGCGRTGAEIEALRSSLGEAHDFRELDVTDDEQVAGWAGAILDRLGPPDLLVNNAALINHKSPLWEVPADDFRRVVDANIRGVFHVIRHFAPAMVARGSGVIVNLSSYWGRSTSAGVAPYCASKWAIEGLTKALAQDLPKGLAAVALNPGIIDTEMLRDVFGDKAGRYLKPEAWAKEAVPFLLGLGPEDNGQSLTVPGQ